MTRNDLSIHERFMQYVSPEPNSGCWLWDGAIGGGGYGSFGVDGKIKKAHRVSWELHNGTIPSGDGYHGTCVLHKCDVPACVNPGHLFLGTHGDNMRDMVAKGRRSTVYRNPLKGTDSPSAKLREDQVHEIYRDTRSNRQIAKEYNIGKTVVGSIKTGKKWQHLTGHKYDASKMKRPKLDEKTAIAVYNAPGTQDSIAEKYGICQVHVSGIKRGLAWSHVTGHAA